MSGSARIPAPFLSLPYRNSTGEEVRAYIRTYGCTLNQADSDIVSSVLEADGIKVSASEKDADVVVVNTCTVKNATSQKILYKLSQLEQSGKRVVVTGCMASANRNLIERYAPKASIVTAPNAARIAEAVGSAERVVLDSYSKTDRLEMYRPGSGTIARIPISDGCTSSCTFCETRYARGALNSFPERLILKAIEGSVANGAKEIQLASQDTGAYGLDRNTDIARLMHAITDIEGNFKVRVGMLNPEHLHRCFDGFREALCSQRFYRFVHLPVESGSNQVLKAMGRHYTVEEFEGYVERLRSTVPGVAVETDIIVGFPTETESDFNDTVGFIRRCKPEVTNISRFGARPHAQSSRMAQNSAKTINSRSRELSKVVRSVQSETNSSLIGSSMEVLITESNSKSMNGRNRSYRQVVVPSGKEMGLELGGTYNMLIKAVSANVLYA